MIFSIIPFPPQHHFFSIIINSQHSIETQKESKENTPVIQQNQ